MKNINIDFWSKVIAVIFAAGILYGQVFAIRNDVARVEAIIERLETKVEKHNNFDRRIVKLETIIEMKGGIPND